MTDYYTRHLVPDDLSVWDRLVTASPQGTLFHRTAWLRAADESFGVLGCFDESDRLLGGLPLFGKQRLGLRTSRPPYFAPYSGPVFAAIEGKRFTQVSTRKKIAGSLAQGLAASFHYAHVNAHYAVSDIQPFLWEGFLASVRHTHLKSLDDLDAALMEMDADRRNDIRKGRRDGLRCEQCQDVNGFLPLLRQSLQAQGMAWSEEQVTQFRRCFAASMLLQAGRLFLARDAAGAIVGGAWLVWDQHRSYHLLTGLDREAAGRTAVPTLVWEMMTFTRQELGLTCYDFQGTDVPQIEGFVRPFAGRLEHCYALVWLSPLLRPVWMLRQLASWSW